MSEIPQSQTQGKAPQAGPAITTKLEGLVASSTRFDQSERDNLLATTSDTTITDNPDSVISLDKRDPAIYQLLTANATMSMSSANIVTGQRYVLVVEQDATGGRTLTSTVFSVVNPGGVTFPIGLAANEISMLVFRGFRGVMILESIQTDLQDFSGGVKAGWPAT